jgi:chaperonin GroEL
LNNPVNNGSTFDIRITGYNFLDDSWVNMREVGIIDPTKVLRVAIENAISVASIIITTSGIITKE